MEISELNRAFGAFSPSEEQRSEMLGRILDGEPDNRKMRRVKKPVAVFIAAAVLLAATGAAAVGFSRDILNYFHVSEENKTVFDDAWTPVYRSHTFRNGWTVEVQRMYTGLGSAAILVDVAAPEGVVLDGERYSLKYFWDEADYRSDGIGGGFADFIPDENKADGRVSFLVTARSDCLEPASLLGLETEFYPYQLIEYSDGQGAEETFDFVGGSWTVDLDIKLSDYPSGFLQKVGRPLKFEEETGTLERVYLSPIAIFCEFQAPGNTGSYAVWDLTLDESNVYLNTRSGGAIQMDGVWTGCMDLHTGRMETGYWPERVLDPEEIVSITVLGQTFPLEDLVPVTETELLADSSGQ